MQGFISSEVTEEIVLVICNLRKNFDRLILRGLLSAGSEDLNIIKSASEEFSQIGAQYLADQLRDLHDKVSENNSEASVSLLKTQVGLYLFERVLTKKIAMDILEPEHAEDI